jgi:hypothetical protein
MATTLTVACYCCAVQVTLSAEEHHAKMEALKDWYMTKKAARQKVRLST